ncbi:MAG: MgtC/SapB family protein [SAR202 cluster bacterium]|nr:MgtC/SapB family protein [SAR202 cluster bacterium]
MAQELQIAARLLIATVLGLAIGLERETARKPAGLRTIALVSLGAAAFTVASVYGLEGLDPARIAAGVVTGVGFLGAGAIWRSGDTVSGITTATTIWAAAAIGLLAGMGMLVSAVLTAAIVLVVLRLLPGKR